MIQRKEKNMKQNIKFKFEGWFYRDVKEQIDLFTDKESIKNNLWLVVAYIYVSSNQKREKPCEFKYLCFNDIVGHANNVDKRLVSAFINVLKDKKIITVNDSYSADLHYAKQYAVSLRYKENLLDIFHSEEVVELNLSKNSFKSWELITKEDLFNILDLEIDSCYEGDKEVKENPYDEYEKNSIGYHEGETRTERVLHDRMIWNFSFNKDKIREHINKSSNQYEELNKLIKFVKSTKHKTYSSIHGRVYLNGYSNGSKEYRDTFMFDEQPLVEIMDVKSCFVLLTVLLAKLKNAVDDNELIRLYGIVTERDIYEEIGTGLTRQQAKLAVLRWFFMSNAAKKRSGWSKDLLAVKNYFKTNFPKYYNWLVNYAEIEVGGKKKKSCLAIDCEWLENKLVINTLMRNFAEHSVITLHDSLWIKKSEYSYTLRDQVLRFWKKLTDGIMFGDNNPKKDEMTKDVEIGLREEEFDFLSFPKVQTIFDNYELSIDVMRQIVEQMDQNNRKHLQNEMFAACTIVKVLTAYYLKNCIKYLQNNMAKYLKEELEKYRALSKFKDRLDWITTPQYQKMHNRQVVYYTDYNGRVIETLVY